VRIELDAKGARLDVRALGWVSDRLRAALGSHSADIESVRALLRMSPDGVDCTVRLFMRGGEVLERSGTGKPFEDVVRFVVARAGSAVARRSENDRLRGK
jgi:hypothetical protein